jgi:hypothetical protein
MAFRRARSARLRFVVATSLCAAICAGSAARASAAVSAHGQVLRLAPGIRGNTTTSSNWLGYALSALGSSVTLYHSISGTWTVPVATQHTAGEAEDSADWIGVGGGCVAAGCDVSDETLIQTGTEQDVSSTGAASYDAWYELVPVPELEISSMTIGPGDRMYASIAQVASDVDVWEVTIEDTTRGETYTTTLPYPSTMDTAEWIEETPLEIGTDAGFAALPNLTDPAFGNATVNGASPDLTTADEIQLVDSSGDVIGTPSAPNAAGDGFSECTWTDVCG